MKRVEIESFVKSFTLFFISQCLLVGALFFVDYKKEIQTLDETIFSKMRICSFDLICEDFKIDFATLTQYELYKLYKNDDELSSYFSIPNSTKNALKIYLPKETYNSRMQAILKSYLLKFIAVLIIIALLSLFFSLYTISPLRNALRVTEEFIKDILHDFNTPLSVLRLNIATLKNEFGSSKKIQRIENSIENILSLQTNLRSYLENHVAQQEKFNLKNILQERVTFMDRNFRDISFDLEMKDFYIKSNKEAFIRIIDNLLTNAAKYNKKNGYVEIHLKDTKLQIKDNGKGIKNPKKVFDRFYKEQERGLGIGLHIVKKLCEELHITITLQSKVDVGTCFYLELEKIVIEH